jgi:hypothetical protein
MSVSQYLARLIHHRDDLAESVEADLAAGPTPDGYAVNAAMKRCTGVDSLFGPAVAEADSRLPTAGQAVRELRRAFDRLVGDAGAAVMEREPLAGRPAWLEFQRLAAELQDLLPAIETSPANGAARAGADSDPPSGPKTPTAEQTSPAVRAVAMILGAQRAGRPLPGVKELAHMVGCDRTTLYRDSQFRAVWEAAQSSAPPPRGWRTDAGDIEVKDDA